MRQTPQNMKELLSRVKDKLHLKSLVIALSAIVVFTTTYMLILPAFTLDKQEAAEQGGIDVVAAETVAETADTEVKEEAPAEVQEEQKAEEKTDANAETAKKSEETKAADKAEPADKTEKSDVKLLTKKKTINADQADGDKFAVSAVVGKDAKVPADVTLTATELDKKTDGFDYDQYKQDALKALKKDSDVKGIKSIKFYDISLESESQDAVEPEAMVNVKIAYEDGMKVDNADNIRIVHFAAQSNGTEKPVVLDNAENKVETTTNASGSKVTEASFDTDGFSKYAVAEVETIEKTISTDDGETYKVTVKYGDKAGIPEGATLDVKELKGDAYDEYLEKTAEKLGKSADELGFAKFFDITIMDGDKEVKIDDSVEVEIKLQDKDSLADSTQVLHFADESNADVVDSTVNGDTVEFKAEGFSVYAVIDESTGNEARMTVKFMKGSTEIARMYIKNSDSDAEIEKIIYDPGAGELQKGEIFMGWSLDKPNYTVDDAKAESSASNPKDIEDIRTWAQNQEITEGDEHTFYAMIFQAHTVSFRDEDGTTINGETLIFNATEGYAPFTVNEAYTPKTQDQNFEGWYWSPVNSADTGALVQDKNGNPITRETPIENGTDIRILGDIVFTPYAPQGYWVVFVANGDGASYTPPQFVLKNNKAIEPSDEPTRLGYTFDGWYEAAGYDAEGNPNKDSEGNVILKDSAFDFNTPINARTRLYAKWTSVTTANYTVIIWKEKAGDTYAENVGEGKERNYDYWKSYTLTGNVGDTITAVSNSNTQTSDINGSYYDVRVSGTRAEGGNVNEVVSETGYHTAKYDTNVKIFPEGNSIVNVYYDRHSVRYTFYYPYETTSQFTPSTSNSQGYYYIPDESSSSGYRQVYLYRDNGTWYIYGETELVETTDNDNNPTKYDEDGNRIYQYNGSWYYVNGNYIDTNRPYDGKLYYLGDKSYSGTKYTLSQSGEWTQYQQETGLYGETLNWPSDTSIWWYETGNNGAVGGARMTYKANFIPLTSNMDVSYYGASGSGSGQIDFLTQDLSGGNNYTTQKSVSMSTGNSVHFDINDKFTGFVAYQYRTKSSANGSWSQWQSVGNKNESTGVYGSTVYYGHSMQIRYRRLSNTIAFMDGSRYVGNNANVRLEDTPDQGKLKETNSYFYEANLTSYNTNGADYYTPEPSKTPEGFVFAGWYADKTCTVPYNFTTMPTTGVTVYAKWVQKQYRVLMHPNVSSIDESLDWGDQQMSYRVNYGEKIAGGNTITGIRDEYDFIGWYLDEACTKPYNFDAYELRDDTRDLEGNLLLQDYPKTEDTELNKYGEATVSGNKDKDPNLDGDDSDERFWVNKKLELYGKWRAKLTGARGITVEFDAVQGEGYFPSAGGNKILHSDGLYYLDRSVATATSSPTASKEDEQFLHWVVQRWNSTSNKYEDVEGAHVYPGDSFEVLKAYAREENLNPEDEGYDEDTNYKKYTMRLRAVYGPKEAVTPTHIHWYANNGTEYKPQYETVDSEYMVRSYDNEHNELLEINEAVPIMPENTFTYEGHKFIGWARVDEPADVSTVERVDHPELKESDLFLRYVEPGEGEAKGHFEAKDDKGNWVTVSKVAADEAHPYHDLYAVWEVEKYKVDITKFVNGSDEDKQASRKFEIGYRYQNEDGQTVTGTVKLSHEQTTSLENPDARTLVEVPYGAIVTVTEENEPNFDKTYSATHKVKVDGSDELKDEAFDAEAEEVAEGEEPVGNKFKITSDTLITVTNSQKSQKVVIKKVDVANENTLLGGATFTVGAKTVTTAKEGEKIGYTEVFELDAGEHVLTETVAPDGYNLLAHDITVTVDSDGVKYTQPDSHGGVDQTAQKDKDGNFVIVITNSAGNPLPHTGGIGTTFFYIFGGVLVIGCSAILYRRRRQAL